MLVTVNSEPHFAQLSSDNKNSLIALNFWAPWAQPSLDMNAVFNELSNRLPSVLFLNIEAEELPELSEAFHISAVPSFVILKAGKILQRINGANAQELTDAISKHAKTSSLPASSKPAPPATAPTEPKLDLNTRLKSLIHTAPLMIFIKGTPAEPRCGFSRQLVDGLNDIQVKYSSFNILADEDVRQGLKKYSDWPTFPQVYLNGELIGGLDIVKQLIESGEFAQMIPSEPDLPTRLSQLVKKDTVMLFIKGTPKEPRCGFSKQIVGIFDDKKVKYSYFDILQDDDVRQGLKDFASWPTFPMIFFKGEFLGGLDIMKEMIQSGEFDQVLASVTNV